MNSLQHSLSVASNALDEASHTIFGQENDPLRLNLPPLNTTPGQGAINPNTLRAAGALYLAAELEQTGIHILAQALADERLLLDIRDHVVHEKLDQYHRARRTFLDQRMRGILFARLFGFGTGIDDATNRRGNSDFMVRMAMLCNALIRMSRSLRINRRAWPEDQVALHSAARALLRNLAPHLYGNTIAAARIINEQLNRSVELLSIPALCRHFGARSMWELLRRFWGENAPDLGRYLDRGRCGQEIFSWLSNNPEAFSQMRASTTLLPDSSVFVQAACWLRASGLENS